MNHPAWRWLRRDRIPLQIKAATLVGAIAAVAILAFGLLLALWASSDLHRRIVDDHLRLSKVVAALVDDYVASIEQNLQTTALDHVFVEEVIAGNTPDLIRHLEPIGRYDSELSALVVIDRNGQVIASSRGEQGLIGVNLIDRDYVQRTLSSGQPVLGPPRRGTATNLAIVPIAVPILANDGTVVGVLQGTLLLTRLSERIDGLRVGERGNVSLISDGGHVIADSDPERLLTASPPSAEAAAALRAGESYFGEQTMPDGVRMFIVETPVQSTGWSVRVRIPTEELDAPVIAQLRNTAIAAAVAFLLAMLVGIAASRQISGPIAELQRATRRLAQGDYSAALPRVRTRDELADVAADFATMVDQLRSSMERLEAEAGESERQRARISAILETIEEAILLVAPSGRILVANASVQRLFGLDPKRLRAADAPAFQEQVESLPIADPSAFLDLVRQAEANRDLVFAVDITTAAPARRDLAVRSSPVRDSSGRYIGRLYAFRDVTQERAADRAKTEFVSLVSHELRTPLTSIRGFTELLLGEEAGKLLPEQAEFLEIIRSNTSRLSRLVDELLDIARIEAGRIELRLEDVPLGPVIEGLGTSLRPQLEAKQHQISVSLPEQPVVVRGDVARIQQILANLLSNALKYTPAGGSIAVTVETSDREALVSVADSGIGLTEADQAKLFTKFFRAKNRLTQESSGTGLGLVITKSLIELHGGKLWYEPEPGVGTTFRFTLPLAGSGQPPTEPDRTATERSSAARQQSRGRH